MNRGSEAKRKVEIRGAIFFWIAIAILLVTTLGAVIRLTVRDAYPVTAVVFYITSPASMTLTLLIAIFCVPRKRICLRRFTTLTVVLAGAWTILAQWEASTPSPMEIVSEAHTLMFWNVCRGHLGWDGIVAKIKEQDPDIIALAELRLPPNITKQFTAERFPGYELMTFPRDLAVISRIPIRHSTRLAWRGGGIFEAIAFESRSGQPFTLLLADVRSELSLHRKEPIGVLVDAVQQLDGPVLLAGDLNTPVDSIFFEPLRVDFRNAFEDSGWGLHATWPMPLPVLAIDHVWANTDVKFHSAQILSTLNSDHRAIFVKFSVAQ